jgi:WD40 repeat protein
MINDQILNNSHLTGLHKRVKQQFNKLEKAIDNFYKEHLGIPERFIYEFFAQIRNKIDIHRELLLTRNKGLNIESIHNRSEKLLSKLKHLEQDCYQNEQKIEKIDLFEKESKKIKMFSNSLRYKHPNIKYFKKNLLEIKKKIMNAIEEVIDKTNAYKRIILMNKTISFFEEDSEQLGYLVVNHRLEMSADTLKSIENFKSSPDIFLFMSIEKIKDSHVLIMNDTNSDIKILSTESGECLKTLTGHDDPIRQIIVSNKYIISFSQKYFKVWAIENDFKCIQTIKQASTCECLLPDNILLIGSNDGYITKWNLNNFTQIGSFKAHYRKVLNIKHVSSFHIISCSGRIVKLWNLANINKQKLCQRIFLEKPFFLGIVYRDISGQI